jgi:formate/nitrite transporter FocA (FNT family)
MNYVKTFIFGILAGISISIGGTVFLSLDNKVLGAVFFTVGLFTVCTFGFDLFTGKVCYVFDRDLPYALSVIVMWAGNFVGAWLTAFAESLTRIGPALQEKAAAMCTVKSDDSFLSLFILGIFCDILIYIGVDGYNKNPHEVGKYLSLLFGATVFILCGTEHCVADMYYFSIADMWNPHTLLCLLVISLGNAFGGVLLPLVRRLR